MMQVQGQISGSGSSLNQKSLMAVLDEMREQGKKLRETDLRRHSDKHSGYLDTQLFPDWTHQKRKKNVKSASNNGVKRNIKGVFQHNQWSITDGVTNISLDVENDLFPSKEYDIGEVKSESFGRALIARLTQGDLYEEAKKLVDENKQKAYEISMHDVSDVDEQKVLEIVCDVIPLNDYQKNIRDRIASLSINAIENIATG